MDTAAFFFPSVLSLQKRTRLHNMTVLSKFLHVCRPHEMFGPANQCNIRSGDVHFWLNQSGEIIDPTPLNESHPHGENVYIPWKTVPSSILPPPNGEMCT